MQTQIFELKSSTSENCYRVTVSCAEDGKWHPEEILVQRGEVTKLVESLDGIYISAEGAIAHAIAKGVLQVWKLENPHKKVPARKK